MKRTAILYLVTLACMATLDMLWLRVVAYNFYESHLSAMLTFRATPAVLFYVMYIAAVLVFVSNSARATSWKAVAGYGAFFGFAAYSTYDLTNLATLTGWSWPVALVDMGWGTFNTAASATVGWVVTKKVRP